MDPFERLVVSSGLVGHALLLELGKRPASRAQLATVLHQFSVIDSLSRRFHALPGQLERFELPEEARAMHELEVKLNEQESREAFVFLAETVLRSYADLPMEPEFVPLHEHQLQLSANAFLVHRFGGAKTEHLPDTLNLAFRLTDRRGEGLESMARAVGGAIVFERVLRSLVIPAFVLAFVESGNYGRLHIDEPGLRYLREGGCRHAAFDSFVALRGQPLFAQDLKPFKKGAEHMCQDLRRWWDGLLFHLF